MSEKFDPKPDTLTVSQGTFWVERHIASTMASAHWHNHVELNLLPAGRMTYLFNGKQEYVEANRLILFWAAIPHQTIEVSENASLVCIYLPLADFLRLPVDRDIRRSIMRGTFLSNRHIDISDAMAAERWVEDWRDGDPVRRELIAEEVRLRVRRLILDGRAEQEALSVRSKATSSGPAVRHAEALTDLINEHFAEPLSLPQLAKLAGIHPATASKAFRDVLGISVNEYLTRYRIARAMQLLADTDIAVLNIAYDCGFGSSSRFYEAFKDRTGQTPLAFRRIVGGSGGDE